MHVNNKRIIVTVIFAIFVLSTIVVDLYFKAQSYGITYLWITLVNFVVGLCISFFVGLYVFKKNKS